MQSIIFLCLALLIILPADVWAATKQIGSPWSASTINSAITNANEGDVIELTGSGTVTWNEMVRIDKKGITLRVRGGTNTPKGSAIFPIVVTSNKSPAILIITTSNKAAARVSGFKFLNPTPEDAGGFFIYIAGKGRGTGNLGAYRVDNNYFDTIKSSSCVAVTGSVGEQTGLIDNNTFLDHTYGSAYTIRIREDWKGGHATCYGYDSWARPFTFGDSRFHFIEDNLFEHVGSAGHHDVSSDGSGGRYVVRYNTFSNAFPGANIDYIDAHGDGCQGLGTGARGGEIYNNTFLGTNDTVGRDINLRGGQWLVYNNTFTAVGYGSVPIRLTEYRASATDCWQGQNPSICNPGVPQCATPASFAAWYPLPGQIRGTYVWNNVYGGSSRAPIVNPTDYVPYYIQEGRDYWACTDLADAKSKGLNSGYAPYVYPHPLTLGSPAPSDVLAPPQNLRIVSYGN